MLDMSWGEVMLIGGVALIVIGPKDLPKALRTVGQITTKLRRMAGEFQMQFNEAIREAELDDVRREVDGIRNTVRSAGTGFNPVQTIRDELKGAVEGRGASKPGAEKLGPAVPTSDGAVSDIPAPDRPVPETPVPETRSLADATAQLRAEQEAAAPAAPEHPSEHPPEGAPTQPVPRYPAKAEAPLPIPGSVDDPYGPPVEPSSPHEAPVDPKNGTAAR